MGCYPAAISDLRFDPRQQGSHHFSIKVEKFDATYNMLSFGLIDRQHFNQSGGNGIGGDSRSVGYQAEASSSNTTAILKSDRNQVGGNVPKVRAGCVMRLEVSFKNFPAHALQPTARRRARSPSSSTTPRCAACTARTLLMFVDPVV